MFIRIRTQRSHSRLFHWLCSISSSHRGKHFRIQEMSRALTSSSTNSITPHQDFPWSQVQQVSYQEANTGTIVQACHAMIYARTDARFVSELPFRAWVLMQMRFDGKLGFPGGIVSDLAVPDATLEDGLNRELEEEIKLDISKFGFNKSHYVISHFCPRVNLILNFYAQEVSEDDFKKIELAALTSQEYGHECLGVLRIPLYTMHDGQNGFPAFLQNQFAGTSVLQVIIGLLAKKIISEEELQVYFNVLPKHQSYKKLVEDALTTYQTRNENKKSIAMNGTA